MVAFCIFGISCRTFCGVFVSSPIPKRNFCKNISDPSNFFGHCTIFIQYTQNDSRIRTKIFYKSLPTCQSECFFNSYSVLSSNKTLNVIDIARDLFQDQLWLVIVAFYKKRFGSSRKVKGAYVNAAYFFKSIR